MVTITEQVPAGRLELGTTVTIVAPSAASFVWPNVAEGAQARSIDLSASSRSRH
ncbi:hypothetical protein [Bradyrhizobium sp. AZCC 2230]|uniref:hypothetical protein n=1 Tax=Bradyrhizobium sp. AZCC 2230 TaxID=3117021 RepID=UPI002FEE6754